jgi:ABC-2 type transport system permease protein
VTESSTSLTTLKAFWGLFARDMRVVIKNLGEFISRTALQPFLFVFVFAYLFPKIGQSFTLFLGSQKNSAISFGTILVPGLVAVAAIMSGIMAVGIPLSVELGATREIEDRIMAPLPVKAVALEKILFGAAQALISALIVFPLVSLVPATPVQIHVSNWALLVTVILLSCLISGSLGLTLGTVVSPQKIGLMFSLLVLPLSMFGCIYYPWARLTPVIWLKIAVLINPLVYSSEGLRQSLTPVLPHMPTWGFLSAMVFFVICLAYSGIHFFTKRTIS